MLYLYRGDAYFFTNQNETAIQDYDQAENYFTQVQPPYKRMTALTQQYRAGALARKGEFVKATTDLQNAIEYFETITDTFYIVATRNKLSILFSAYRFFDKVEEQHQEFLKLGTSSNAQLAAM